MSTRPSSADDKTTIVGNSTKQSPSGTVTPKETASIEFSQKGTEKSDTGSEAPPVSLFTLFRFSTPFELFLDVIGIVAAAAAGAAQPMMALLFGNLTQEFASFGTVVGQARAGNETAAALVPEAIRDFRRVASADALYLVYTGIGIFVCTFISMYAWVYTGEVNAKRIRERYLQAVLRQDIAFFDNVGAGEVSTRIQTDTHLVQQGISEKIALVVVALGAFVCGFILAYIRSWRLALALTSMLPCIVLSGGIMNFFMTKYMQLSLKHVADAGNLAEEVISTVRTAQAFGTQPKLSTLYDRHVEKALGMDIKTAIWNGGGLGSVFFVIYSSYGLAFSYGTTLLNRGQATPGIIINVMLSILIGSFALTMIAPDVQAIASACGAAAKLFQTIDRVPEIDSADERGLKPSNVTGEITLENVEFHYPSRPSVQVVKGLSITFEAGKTAALVGASGSGKSTVVSLVERFYDPTQGVVKLDGINLKDLNLKWLRSQIGLVSQEPTLFATTIRENVAHGLIGTQWENAEDEKKFDLIKDACIKANADGFISKLPNGYDTMVGERGFLLSGGQKQRVAIARAIVSDPRILLLDEATSALDTQSEGVVQDALDKAAAGRTTITIAHRLSTVKDADVIYVMGEGVVLESGTHLELLAKDGAYARLVHSQKLRESQDALHVEDESEDLDVVGDDQDMGALSKDEIPLVRRSSQRSVASQALSQKRLAASKGDKERVYSLFYLFKRFGAIIKDQWPRYLFTFIAAAGSGCAYPAFGVVFAKGIEGFTLPTREERRHEGDRVALWFFIIAVGATLTLATQICLGSSAAVILASRLRSKGFRAILRQDIEFFDRDENNTGALTAKLSDNPQKINGLAGVTLAAIVQAVATVISGSILGLVIIWKLALVGIACTPALISTGYIRLRVVDMKDGANKKAHEESAQLACEAASSIRTVAALTREADCLRLYSRSLEAPLKRSNRISLFSQALYAFSQSLTFFVIALNFWYGTQLVTNFEAGTLEFFIGLMATTFSAMSSGSVFMFVPDMSSAQSAGSDLLRLLDATPDIDAESGDGKKLDAQQVKGHIRFDNVHFRYPTRPGVRVLRGLSFEVKPGTYIALVGASGSGKSTVIQLIERFYDPLAGDILLDGERIGDMNVQNYRKHLALVSQEPTLYAGTIRFNILLGATKPESEVTQEEIEDACRKANILEFIKTLPDGFDTEVGGKGSQLSGGQKQRIAIARALLRNPKVLLLDEATSALDSNSEKVVQAALDEAAKGRTTIAIAHRLSTIQNADTIYFVKDGVVSESGTHDQLIAKRGDYYEYVQLQALSKA